MSIMLNSVPLKLNVILTLKALQDIYLNALFDKGWLAFYQTCIGLLKVYQSKILKRHDFESIIGQLKQVRPGGDHLIQSCQASAVRRVTTNGNEYSLNSISSVLDMSSASITMDNQACVKLEEKFEHLWTHILQTAMTAEWDETVKRDISTHTQSSSSSSDFSSDSAVAKSEENSKFDINQSLHQYFFSHKNSLVPGHL